VPSLIVDSPVSELLGISMVKLLECKNLGDKTAEEFERITITACYCAGI